MSLHLLVMSCDNVLLFLLPVELMPLKLFRLFDLLTLLLESTMSLVVDLLQV